MPRDTPPDPASDQAGPFPEARSAHDAISERPGAYPDGWVEQVRFRERYDLPPFRPPRFEDDVDVAATVESIEAERDVDVSFVAYAPGEWVVELDGERAFGLPRHRDDASNVVVETTASAFAERVEEALPAAEEGG